MRVLMEPEQSSLLFAKDKTQLTLPRAQPQLLRERDTLVQASPLSSCSFSTGKPAKRKLANPVKCGRPESAWRTTTRRLHPPGPQPKKTLGGASHRESRDASA